MTEEEKRLLLIDLCARLPFRVKCNAFLKQIDGSFKSVFGTFKGYNGWAAVGNNLVDIETVKPYLRPMSSMTEEEKEEFENLVFKYDFGDIQFPVENTIMYWDSFEEVLNYLISHHFDFRGLIEKGLAFEAPKDMYKL